MKVEAGSKSSPKQQAIVTLRRGIKKYKVFVSDIRKVYRLERIYKPIPVFEVKQGKTYSEEGDNEDVTATNN